MVVRLVSESYICPTTVMFVYCWVSRLVNCSMYHVEAMDMNRKSIFSPW